MEGVGRSSCYSLLLLLGLVVAIATGATFPYNGPVLLVGSNNTIQRLNPQDGSVLFPPVTFPSTVSVRALAADPDARLYYALVTNATTTWIAQVGLETGLAQNQNVVVLPGVVAPFGRCGLAYSAPVGLVASIENVQSTLYFVNFTNGSVTPNATSAVYPADVAAGIDQSNGGSIIAVADPASRFLHFYSIAALTSGSYYNYTVTGNPDATTILWDTVGKKFYSTGLDAFRVIPTSLGTVAVEPFAVSTELAQRIVTISSYAQPSRVYIWASFPNNKLCLYVHDYNAFTLATTIMEYNATALAHLPTNGTLTPAQPEGSSTTANLGGQTPEFSIADTSSTNTSETTKPNYGAFITNQGNAVPFPTTWNKDQSELVGGSGITTDGLTVESSGSGSTYSYSWSGNVEDQALSVSALYNPTSVIQVTTPDGLSYALPKGAVKFTVSLSGNNVSELFFDNDPSAELTWSTCFENDEALGQYDLDYTSARNDNDTATTYSFRRLSDATQLLRVSIPSQAVADDEIVSAPHSLEPAPYRDDDGLLRICVTWQFPHFENSLFYDPDISVLINPDEGDGSGDGNSDSDDNILVIAVPVAVGGAALCCCVVVVTGLIIGAVLTWRRKHRARAGSVIGDEAL